MVLDVFCVWIPETFKSERHKHPFELTVVPKVDSDPYYCDGCEKIRDTDLTKVKQDYCREFSRIALSQLLIGLSVVIDCDLSHESGLFFMRDLSRYFNKPLFVVECKTSNEDAHELGSTFSNFSLEESCETIHVPYGDEYHIGDDTPKLFVDIATPTIGGINRRIAYLLQSISFYCKEWTKETTNSESKDQPYGCFCSMHSMELGLNYSILEDDKCDRCSQQLLSPIIKCGNCSLVNHKTCTDLLSVLPVAFGFHGPFAFREYGDVNDKLRCTYCKELVKGYALSYESENIYFHFGCLFLPPKPGINLHQHLLSLSLGTDDFTCGACGSSYTEKLHYKCDNNSEICTFEIGVNCGWLQETVSFERHRHSFHLAISPEHDSNQYYCDVCEKERDKKH